MVRTTLAALAAAVVTIPATAGIAQAVTGPVQVPFDSVTQIRFVSRQAGWVGELSLLGTVGNVTPPAFLMANNVGNTQATNVVGTFDAGDQLLFQYKVTQGASHVYRQDTESGLLQFKHEFTAPNTVRLYVEDIPLPGGDNDYNDAVFELAFEPLIPTPGTAALAGLGGLALLRRRRR